MNDRIKETFEMIKAEEELKNGTRDFIYKNTQNRRIYNKTMRRKMIPAVVCLMFIFLGCGGYWVYFTPTAVLGIDINPSVELDINRFDKVISVNGYNDDGKALAETLDIRFKDYEDAVDMILADEKIASLLAQDEILTISVSGPDGQQCERIYSHIETCTSKNDNVHCYSAGEEEAEKAHDMGLSCSRYRAFLKLSQLDPNITPEEINNMTMKEINDLISSLAEGENIDSEYSNGRHENGHHGSENGNKHE